MVWFSETEPRKCSHGTGFLTLVFRLLRMMPQIELGIPLLLSTLRSELYIYSRKRTFHQICILFSFLLLIVAALKNNECDNGKYMDFISPEPFFQPRGREIQMTDLAGSMADGTMASKAVEIGQRDCSFMWAIWERDLGAILEILNSYKVSSTDGLEKRKKFDWRRNIASGEREHRSSWCVQWKVIFTAGRSEGDSTVKGGLTGELLWKRAEGKKIWKHKEKCETKIVSTSLVLQKPGTLIWWIHIQRVPEKPPLLSLTLFTLYTLKYSLK